MSEDATALSGNQQDEWERKRTVHLNGDRHETIMTERSGLFSIYCGCGWKVQDLPITQALSAEAGHPDDRPIGPRVTPHRRPCSYRGGQ